MDAPFLTTLLRVDHVENESNTLLLLLDLNKGLLPRNVLIEEDNTA